MKRNIILVGLIGVNCILASMIVVKFLNPAHAERSHTHTLSLSNSVPMAETKLARDHKKTRSDVTNHGLSASAVFHWKQLHARDYKQYVANLRAVQCPEETIQDIII